MKSNLFLSIIALIILSSLSSAFLISDQGTDVKNVSTGNLTALANLTIDIYDNATGGTLVFEQNFSNTIVNGSWNVMINPDLEYGKSYYKDYQINGEDLDFDGNERLEFQSFVGNINNVSFINFSLLTNYALKNQSETFTGNITTTQTGFFGWLGSLVSRITSLFVQDIDFNGTINGSGNITTTGNITADYYFGDGSQLSNLPAGTDTFVANYSTFLTISAWNDTGLIKDWNTTGYIKDWAVDIVASNTSIYDWIVGQAYTSGGINWANAVNGTLATWGQAMNGTLMSQEDWNTNYTSNNDLWLAETLWNANYSVFLTQITWTNVVNGTMATWEQAMNGTLLQTSQQTNLTEDDVEGYIFDNDNTNNLNMSTYNITMGGNNNARFCFVQDCSSYMYHNGTGIIISS